MCGIEQLPQGGFSCHFACDFTFELSICAISWMTSYHYDNSILIPDLQIEAGRKYLVVIRIPMAQ